MSLLFWILLLMHAQTQTQTCMASSQHKRCLTQKHSMSLSCEWDSGVDRLTCALWVNVN